MAAPIEEGQIQTIREKFRIKDLRDHQMKAICALKEGKDVFLGTSTGSGKSLTYECFPLINEGATVLIVAPLVGIMSEQCKRLNEYGFSVTYIGRDHSDDDKILDGKYDFVFGSPESLLENMKWRTMLKSVVYQDKLGLLVVDEAHTVINWGEGSKSEDPFRECFSRIGEIRSLCKKPPLLALTATSGPKQRRQIMKTLCFRPHCEVIVESPDRLNLKISSMCIPNNNDLDTTFKFLIDELSKLENNFPRHVVFCETIVNVSKIYSVFVKHFGQACELFNMYHSKTNEKVKEKIRNDMMVSNGKIRVLICTNSAGMGVNFQGLNNIIHYGLPREMDTFVQQMGRAGRDGNFGHELIMFKAHKGHLKHTESDLVKLAKDSTQCRHRGLCYSYAVKHILINPMHNCCDVCEKKCKCGDNECPGAHVAFKTEKDDHDDSDTEEKPKHVVSNEDRILLRHKLFSLKYSLEDIVITHFELLHGLTNEVIDDIVLKCDIIFSTADILSNFPIWSFDVALKVFCVICEVLSIESETDSDDDSSDISS